MQKGAHLRRWLASMWTAIEHDVLMVTDAYNGESRGLHPGDFVENRHEQSLASLSRKVLGSILLSNTETACGVVQGTPFLACRDRQ